MCSVWFTEVSALHLPPNGKNCSVLTRDGAGAYAEYVCVSSRMLIPKPSDWSWEFAAAIPEVGSPFTFPCWFLY
jgi:NADPH:quinone reductase-like Zn-dependent oxidoreductase